MHCRGVLIGDQSQATVESIVYHVHCPRATTEQAVISRTQRLELFSYLESHTNINKMYCLYFTATGNPLIAGRDDGEKLLEPVD